MEAPALRLELAPQLPVVVDLPVVDEPERAVRARERLHARIGEVDDRKPAEAERDPFGRVRAVPVGPAVVELRRYPPDGLGLSRPPERHGKRRRQALALPFLAEVPHRAAGRST